MKSPTVTVNAKETNLNNKHANKNNDIDQLLADL